MTIAAAAGRYLSGFTFKFWLAVCAALLACLPVTYCKGRADGRAIEREAQATVERKATEEAREADQAAGAVVDAEQDSVATSNARAEEAARQSDDPLKAGLDSIRGEQE